MSTSFIAYDLLKRCWWSVSLGPIALFLSTKEVKVAPVMMSSVRSPQAHKRPTSDLKNLALKFSRGYFLLL
jgi:hypothetical protein